MSVAVGVAVPQPAPPTYYYQPQPQPCRPPPSCRCCRIFLWANLVSGVVIGLVVLILHLAFHPHLPHFRLESLTLSNFSLAYTSYSSASQTGTCDVRFAVSNPNKKMSISYDSVQSALYYNSALISSTLLPSFQQGKHSQMVLEASFSKTDSYVQKGVVDGINKDMAHGTVSFDVIVYADVEFKAGYNTENRQLLVLCQGLAITLSSNNSGFGTMVAGAGDCMVYA